MNETGDTLILALDTSGSEGSVALIKNGTVLLEEGLPERRNYGRDLVPVLRNLFSKANFSPDRMDLLAVDTGPGSFTGLRVGITTAKMIAWAADVPVAPVVSLDALAFEQAQKLYGQGRHNAALLPLVDAYRDEVFVAAYKLSDVPNEGTPVYEWPDAMLTRSGEYRVIKPAELVDFVEDGVLIFGDGLIKHHAELKRTFSAEGLLDSTLPPGAYSVGMLGAEMARRKELNAPFEVRAFYLRRASVTVK